MLKWTLLIVRSHRHGQVADLPRCLHCKRAVVWTCSDRLGGTASGKHHHPQSR